MSLPYHHENSNQKQTFIIWGAGLAGKLCALALRKFLPQSEILVIEKQPGWSATHTWSFFETDIPPSLRPFVLSLPLWSWPGYEVRFPNFQRYLDTTYFSLREADLNLYLQKTSGIRFVFAKTWPKYLSEVKKQFPTAVHVNAMGWPEKPSGPQAYQKFVGIRFRLDSNHGLDHPILMDATVPQQDGYRFFYVLPYGPKEVLIEDTYYSVNNSLNIPQIKEEIQRYLTLRGWKPVQEVHEEFGILPLPLGFSPHSKGKNKIQEFNFHLGANSGFIHPVTGYSTPTLFKQIEDLIEYLKSKNSCYSKQHSPALIWILLNRFLFWGASDSKRYRIFLFFYRKNTQRLIEKFYSLRMGFLDFLAFFAHWPPPISVSRAIKLLLGFAFEWVSRLFQKKLE